MKREMHKYQELEPVLYQDQSSGYQKTITTNLFQRFWHTGKHNAMRYLIDKMIPTLFLDVGSICGSFLSILKRLLSHAICVGMHVSIVNRYPDTVFRAANTHKLASRVALLDVGICIKSVKYIVDPRKFVFEVKMVGKHTGIVTIERGS